MAHTSSGCTQAGDKPVNTSLSAEIENYLLKMRNIENAKTLNLLKRAKQMMKTLKIRVIIKKKYQCVINNEQNNKNHAKNQSKNE